MPIGNPVTLTSNVASKTISSTATASQTLFNIQGGYRINAISVYRNGVKLVDGTDYIARDGASVTLLSAASEGDVLEFQIFDDFRVSDAIVSSESEQTIHGNLTVTGTLTGGSVGVQSGGTLIGSATTLNFVGYGNTFSVNGNTIDISVAGSGVGGLGTAVKYSNGAPSPFSYIDVDMTVSENLNLDTISAGATNSYVVSVSPNISVASGVAVTVGSGKTMIIDILKIGDL